MAYMLILQCIEEALGSAAGSGGSAAQVIRDWDGGLFEELQELDIVDDFFAEAFFEPKAARSRVMGQSAVNLDRLGADQ